MPRFLMTFNSAAKPGRGEEYSDWCRTQHFADVLRVPGVITGRRYHCLLYTSPSPRDS